MHIECRTMLDAPIQAPLRASPRLSAPFRAPPNPLFLYSPPAFFLSLFVALLSPLPGCAELFKNTYAAFAITLVCFPRKGGPSRRDNHNPRREDYPRRRGSAEARGTIFRADPREPVNRDSSGAVTRVRSAEKARADNLPFVRFR